MTDRVALVLALIIAGAIASDYWLNDATGLLFLGRKAVEFLDYVIFWS